MLLDNKKTNTQELIVRVWSVDVHRQELQQDADNPEVCLLDSYTGIHSANLWSFRKSGTIGTLASQAKIGISVQAPGRFCVVRWCHPQ